MSTFDVGAVARLDILVADDSNTLTDPATLSLTITLPDGSTLAVSYAGGQIVKTATGTYHYDYTPAVSGHFTYRVVTTGAVQLDWTDEFDVRSSTARLLVSLEDVKNHLKFPDEDTTKDDALRDLIEAATPVIERLTGPIVPRTVTAEWHDGGRGRTSINLHQRPVISVSAITEYLGNVAYSLTQAAAPDQCTQFSFSLNAETGTITRRAGAGVSYPFPPGEQNISVTYLAGFAVTPANIRTGALEVIRHVWQSTQQGGGQRFKNDPAVGEVAPGRGYLLSYFAAQFFQPNERIPGIA